MVEYKELILSWAFFTFISLVFLRISFLTGFWRQGSVSASPPLPLSGLIVFFVIYLGITTFVAPFSAFLMESFWLSSYKIPPPDAAYGYLQVVWLMIVFLLFYLYTRSAGKSLFSTLWKRDKHPPSSILTDIGMGLLAWIISFPIVNAVGEGIDLCLYLFTSFQGYEQVAITYLKTAIQSPPLLMTALFTILIAAPCIEEFLFRGCLQTYLKQLLPTKGAIVLSSLCFALFHFSFSQGLGNLSLCGSLFVLALFLGFLYERQGSLFACTALHFSFNLISSMRIIFSS